MTPAREPAPLPAVLLLHGQPGSAADWRGVADRLDGRARVIAPDRPGWDGASAPRDLRGNAAAALAALDGHGVDRAIVVGHSLGAAIAAWLAVEHPERVDGLVLAAPAANCASLYPVDRWLAAPVAGEVAGAVTMAGAGLALSVPRLRRALAASARVDEGYLVAARRSILLRPAAWRAYATEQRVLVRELPALERRLHEVTAPTTILAGAADRVVPPRAVRELATQIPGARLRVSEHDGHLLPQSDPELIVDAVLAALDGRELSSLRRA